MKKFLFVFLISCFSLTIISCGDEPFFPWAPVIAEATKGFEQKYGGRLASLLELHKGRPVTKEHHKKLLKAEGPEDVYLFYIDQEEIA